MRVMLSKYVSTNDNLYEQCRVRQDTWHSWQGGECPIPEGLEGEVLRRDRSILFHLDNLRWSHANNSKDNDRDIIAFKITGKADRWE